MSQLRVDGNTFNNVSIESLKRNVNIQSGKNAGTLLTGYKYYDTQASYLSYTMVINASTLEPEDYDSLFDLFTAAKEYVNIWFPYGQVERPYKCHISKISDECIKRLGDHTLWGKMTITFECVKPIDVVS